MKWLIPVRKSDPFSGKTINVIYAVDCEDPFHAMGEIFYRSIEEITWMQYSEDTPEKRAFWKEAGIKIHKYSMKYSMFKKGETDEDDRRND